MVKKRLNKLKMVELSACDKPAQEHALAVIMKRDDVKKNFSEAVLTIPDDTGHSHVIWVNSNISESSYSHVEGDEFRHTHPVQMIDGVVRIGESSGHSHEVDSDELSIMLQTIRIMETFDRNSDEYPTVMSKCRYDADMRRAMAKAGRAMEDGSFPIMDSSDLNLALKSAQFAQNKEKVVCHIMKRANELGEVVILPPIFEKAARHGVAILEDVTMPENQNPASDEAELKKKVDTLENELAKARAFGDLTDEEKEHYKSLDNKGKEEFLKKSADSRKVDIEKSKSSNPVVYTSDDGVEFYKRDDPRLVSMAKSRDEDRRELEKARKERQDMEFQKRAETELQFLPGDIKTRAAILKAVEGIEDVEIRKSAFASLQAKNSDMSKAFERSGTATINADLTVNNAELQLEKMAKEYSEKNKVGYFEAYDAVSSAHPELLEKALS